MDCDAELRASDDLSVFVGCQCARRIGTPSYDSLLASSSRVDPRGALKSIISRPAGLRDLGMPEPPDEQDESGREIR